MADDELDLNQLDNFESDFDSFDIGDSDTKGRKPASRAKENLKFVTTKTAKGTLSGVGTAIKKEMPETAEGVTAAVDMVKESANLIKEAKDNIRPMVDDMRKSANTILPLTKKLMPKKLYDTLERKLKSDDDDYRAKSKEEILKEERENIVSGALDNIFQKQQETAQAEATEHRMEKVLDRATEQTLHKDQMEGIDALYKELQLQSNFINTTFSAYMKKDLELKYKQLFVSQDILGLVKIITGTVNNKLEEIKHNTSLPDIQKQNKMESIKENLRGKFAESIGSKMTGFGKKILSNVKEKVADKLVGGAGMAKDLLGNLAMAAEMQQSMRELTGEEPDAVKNILGFGGGLGGKLLGSKLGKLALKKSAGLAGAIEEGSFDLKGEAIRKMVKLKDRLTEAGNPAAEFIASLIPELSENTNIENTLFNKGEDATSYDIASRQTLVEIIPGHLSRIEKILTELKTGEAAEEYTYDVTKREFVSVSSLRSNVMEKAFGKKKYNEGAAKTVGTLKAAYTLKTGKSTPVENIKEDLNRLFINMGVHGKISLNFKKLQEYIDEDKTNSYINNLIVGVNQPKEAIRVLIESCTDKDGNINSSVVKMIEREITNLATDDSYKQVFQDMLGAKGYQRYFKDMMTSTGSLDTKKLGKIKAKVNKKQFTESVNSEQNYAKTKIEESLKAKEEFKEAFTSNKAGAYVSKVMGKYDLSDIPLVNTIQDVVGDEGERKKISFKKQPKQESTIKLDDKSIDKLAETVKDVNKTITDQTIEQSKKIGGYLNTLIDKNKYTKDAKNKSIELIKDNINKENLNKTVKDQYTKTKKNFNTLKDDTVKKFNDNAKVQEIKNSIKEEGILKTSKKLSTESSNYLKDNLNKKNIKTQYDNLLKKVNKDYPELSKIIKDSKDKLTVESFNEIQKTVNDAIDQNKYTSQIKNTINKTINESSEKIESSKYYQTAKEKINTSKQFTNKVVDNVKSKGIKEIGNEALEATKELIQEQYTDVKEFYKKTQTTLTDTINKSKENENNIINKLTNNVDKLVENFNKKSEQKESTESISSSEYQPNETVTILTTIKDMMFEYFGYRKEQDVLLLSTISGISANGEGIAKSKLGPLFKKTGRTLGKGIAGGAKMYTDIYKTIFTKGADAIKGISEKGFEFGKAALPHAKELTMAAGGGMTKILQSYFGLYGTALGGIGKGAGTLGKAIFGKSGKKIVDEPFVNIYLKGDITPGNPLLSRRQQEKGVTFASGETLKRSEDITEPVFNPENKQCIITEENIKQGLVDVDGNPLGSKKGLKIVKGKGKSLFGKGLGDLYGAGKKGIGGIFDFYLGSYKGLISGASKGAGALMEKMFGSKTDKEWQKNILERLDKILDYIKPDKVREGSYEDYLNDKESDNVAKTKQQITKKAKSKLTPYSDEEDSDEESGGLLSKGAKFLYNKTLGKTSIGKRGIGSLAKRTALKVFGKNKVGKTLGKLLSKGGAKKVLGKSVAKIGVKAGSKGILAGAAKAGIGKALGKAIPIASLAASGIGAYKGLTMDDEELSDYAKEIEDESMLSKTVGTALNPMKQGKVIAATAKSGIGLIKDLWKSRQSANKTKTLEDKLVKTSVETLTKLGASKEDIDSYVNADTYARFKIFRNLRKKLLNRKKENKSLTKDTSTKDTGNAFKAKQAKEVDHDYKSRFTGKSKENEQLAKQANTIINKNNTPSNKTSFTNSSSESTKVINTPKEHSLAKFRNEETSKTIKEVGEKQIEEVIGMNKRLDALIKIMEGVNANTTTLSGIKDGLDKNLKEATSAKPIVVQNNNTVNNSNNESKYNSDDATPISVKKEQYNSKTPAF